MAFQKYIHPVWYAISDFVTTTIAWVLFFILERQLFLPHTNLWDNFADTHFWTGLLFIPLGWLMLYSVTGSYLSIYKKSRLKEFTITFITSIIGTVILFFIFLLNDAENNSTHYYYFSFFTLFLFNFILSFAGRAIILSEAKKQINNGTIRFNAAIIGNTINEVKDRRF
jgi:polysaccharide biosynthesis protein PslA